MSSAVLLVPSLQGEEINGETEISNYLNYSGVKVVRRSILVRNIRVCQIGLHFLARQEAIQKCRIEPSKAITRGVRYYFLITHDKVILTMLVRLGCGLKYLGASCVVCNVCSPNTRSHTFQAQLTTLQVVDILWARVKKISRCLTSAIFVTQIRKSPDITKPHRITNAREKEFTFAVPSYSFFLLSALCVRVGGFRNFHFLGTCKSDATRIRDRVKIRASSCTRHHNTPNQSVCLQTFGSSYSSDVSKLGMRHIGNMTGLF